VRHSLSPEEAHLWDLFVSLDTDLHGTVSIQSIETKLLTAAGVSTNAVGTLTEHANTENEIEFVDILIWLNNVKSVDRTFTWRTSLQHGISQFFSQYLETHGHTQSSTLDVNMCHLLSLLQHWLPTSNRWCSSVVGNVNSSCGDSWHLQWSVLVELTIQR